MQETKKGIYKRLVVFYFSGTGNARQVAGWIAAKANENGVEAYAHSIARHQDIDRSWLDKNTLLGFCYPTHGFNAAPNMIKFVRKFPEGKADAFVLNTRAGLKLYKLHVPGIGGMALWLPAMLLFLKGYRVRGFRPSDMPSNWISLHPGVRNKVKGSIIAHCHKTIDRFTARIISGKTVLNGLFWMPLDIVLVPVSVGYYFFGRFAIAKTFFANFNCNQCNLCVKQCPVKAIEMRNRRPYWTFNCESCMKCMNSCPKRAIETAHGYTAFLWWVVFTMVPAGLLYALVRIGAINQDFYFKNQSWIHDLIWISTGLIIIFFGYRLLHMLLGIKLINKLVTLTSLTHYRFWRRYLNDGVK